VGLVHYDGANSAFTWRAEKKNYENFGQNSWYVDWSEPGTSGRRVDTQTSLSTPFNIADFVNAKGKVVPMLN
jgi:hypothetical protein